MTPVCPSQLRALCDSVVNSSESLRNQFLLNVAHPGVRMLPQPTELGRMSEMQSKKQKKSDSKCHFLAGILSVIRKDAKEGLEGWQLLTALVRSQLLCHGQLSALHSIWDKFEGWKNLLKARQRKGITARGKELEGWDLWLHGCLKQSRDSAPKAPDPAEH